MSGLFSTPTTSTTDTRINSMRIQQSAFGFCQPLIYGSARVAANMFWYGDFKSYAHTEVSKSGGKGGGSRQEHTSFTYTASLMLGLCENEIQSIGKIWKDKDQLIPTESGGITLDPIDQLKFELYNGANNPIWPYLTSLHPDQALNYRYLGYVAASDYELGGSAGLQNHNFEVISAIKFSPEIADANPADIIEDFVRNARYGAAPEIFIGNLDEFRTYCAAANLLFSPALIEQRDAHEIIEELVEAANCAVVPSDGGFTIKTYGDAVITNNGVTFTPDLTPAYHLTDDDFIDDEIPVTILRSRDTDAYNNVQVEYCNRYNQYNTEPVSAQDQANIEMFGLRSEDVVNYSFICDPKIARHVAQLRLQKFLYVRNQYKFRLSWKYCRLEPMDIVTLTSLQTDLNQVAVRIMEIDEDEDGLLSIMAEELAVGSRSAIEYDLQASNGYQGGSNAPGDIFAPSIFEPPLEMTNGLRSVWIAVAGGVDWGGCTVWTSMDDTTYESIGTIFGSARYGKLVTALNPTDTSVTIELNAEGQMFSGTLEDAEANLTLIKLGDEYATYVNATLVASKQYTLDGLMRGRFDDESAHVVNEPFVRLDKAIFKHSYDAALDKKQIFFKFTSFNGLQEKVQALEDVTAYAYTLNGCKPSSVKGLALQSPFVGTSFKAQWLSSTGADLYHIQILDGSTLKRAVTAVSTDYSYTVEEAIIDGLGRNYVVRVASENQGVMSSFAEITIANPIPAKMLNIYTSSTADAISINWNPSDEPDLKDYAVWISTNGSFDPSANPPNWTGTALATEFRDLPSTTTYYLWVTARDVWKEGLWNYSDRITVTTDGV